MAPGNLRNALGVVKDQTSITLAKVGSKNAPDLDVALVKATSHDELPANDKHIQEILHLTSYSRGYINVCVAGLAKRLGKTHNWIVALKSLMLIHRLLLEGDASFEQELLHANRRGMRVLNLSHFRDESHSNAWDYSAFVRTYALFLDEQLHCSVTSSSQDHGRSRYGGSPGHGVRRSSYGTSPGRYDESPGYGDRNSSGYGDRRSPDYEKKRDNYDDRRYHSDRHNRDNDERQMQRENVPVKEMDIPMLLEKLPALQRLMDRMLGCRPTGAAKSSRLVQIALYPMVRESFQLYADICDGLTILLDGFFDMEYQDCNKAYEIYNRSAKQFDELASFYGVCTNLGVGRTSEYPTVQKVPQEHLDTLEDFLRGRSQRPRSPEPEPLQLTYRPQTPEPEPEPEAPVQEAPTSRPETDSMPSPPTDIAQVQSEPVRDEGDLLSVEKSSISRQEQEDKFALALFSGTSRNWETFGPGTDEVTEQSNSTSQSDELENGKSGWELALVASASNLSKPAIGTMAGGFNPLLLDSMYEQGAVRQKQAAATIPSGSYSSVALPTRPGSAFLALPASPGGMPLPDGGEDPFLASLPIPPPTYVQMADMTKKQQLLVQEQMLWQQYQADGMHGEQSFMRLYNNPYIAGMVPQNSFNFPHYGVGMPMQSYYMSY